MTLSRRSTQVALVCGVALLAGCAKSDTKGTTDTLGAMTPAAGGSTSTTTASGGAIAATPISFADVAGTWHLRSVPAGGTDTTATEYTMTSTRDSTGWKAHYQNGLTVPVRVSSSGDSIIADSGPFKSVRRKGLVVTTHGVFRKQGDKLVGLVTAHYKTKGADSVLTLRTEGTRAP